MSSRGERVFDKYYESLFGTRWIELRKALSGPAKKVCRWNGFANRDVPFESEFAHVRWSMSEHKPSLLTEQIYDSYQMDLASIFAAVALDVQPGQRVLDMCAAPGGKTLILAEALFRGHLNSDHETQVTGGELVANEISLNRRQRLQRVLREYVPTEFLARIRVEQHDASRWCLYEPSSYDRVLIDAPCSGERHLLENPTELRNWSESRTKNLSIRQYSLLASAIQTVKPRGRVVYSTCAISPRENDAVIERLLKRRPDDAKVLSGQDSTWRESVYPPPIGEPTKYGWVLLPDHCDGAGPIYFSILERTQIDADSVM